MTTTPATFQSKPTRKFAVQQLIFKNKWTDEYSIRIRGGNGRWRWLSLGTKDRLEAHRRLEATGVGQILQVADDEAFKQRVIEVLQAGQMTLGKLVDEWLADTEMRVSTLTMPHYRAIGTAIITELKEGTDIRNVTAAEVNGFINRGISLTMRQRRRSVLDDLFTFAFDQGYRKDNIGARLRTLTHDLTFDQMERKQKHGFTQSEYDAMLACEDIQGFWRWSIQLAWWLGLRRVDVCNLQWGAFCSVPGKLVVWQRKTRRRVEFDLSEPLLGSGVIPKVIAEMRAEATDATYCFPEMRDLYKRNHSVLQAIFAQKLEAAGLKTSKGFHCLRVSAAQRWRDAGRSINEIGEMLGHSGTGNTAAYLEKSE